MRPTTLRIAFLMLAAAGWQTAAWSANRKAILIGINVYNPPNGSVNVEPGVRGAGRKALLKGDPRHWYFPDLDGAINDIRLMESVLRSAPYNFQDSEIVRLENEQATAEAILKTLRQELVTGAGSGDTRLVYYSGHGNFIRNLGSKERDQLDQTFVPADNWKGAVDVRDKELAQILWNSAQRGVTVTFIADSCHSGSITRGPLNQRGKARTNAGVRGPAGGADFDEPVINDPAPVDQAGKPLDPEQAGVLTLAAAQRNESALEVEDAEHVAHGAMTLALVRALQEEGPNQSMNVIFDRMLNYLKADNLPQTPVLGGKGRGSRDLFGQPAQARPFSVLVKARRGDDLILQGGQAIGIYEKTELKRVNSKPAEIIVGAASLAESTARVIGGNGAVAVGDRFEVVTWATPPESNLRVYMPPAARETAIREVARQIGSLRGDASIRWVEDASAEAATDVLQWSGKNWVLDHVGPPARSVDLGLAPSAADVRKLLARNARFLLVLPPSSKLSAAIEVGAGTPNRAIEKLDESSAREAQYRLAGRINGAAIEYSWILADAVSSGTSLPSLPPRSNWWPIALDAAGDAGAGLTDAAVRLGRIRAWLKLQGRPGQAAFPYHLVLRKVDSNVDRRGGELRDKEQYKLYLRLDPAYSKETVRRRWVYVFAIDQAGTGTLLFPHSGHGNEGNHMPPAKSDEDLVAAATRALPLFPENDHDLDVAEPFGTDTYILLSTNEQLPDPEVLNFEGVQKETRGGSAGGRNPLQDLLASVGSATRGAESKQAPGEWSIERLSFRSVPAAKRN